jgi:hypothetical protein
MEEYRRFWDASFSRLDAHLRKIQQVPKNQEPGNEHAAEHP